MKCLFANWVPLKREDVEAVVVVGVGGVASVEDPVGVFQLHVELWEAPTSDCC